MKNTLFTIAFLTGLSATSFAQQKTGFHLIQTHKIQSDGGWDYLSVDQKNNNLYISHGNQVNIINKNTGDSTGVIHNTSGVHGIAIASSFEKGYTTNGRTGTCTVFDLSTSSVIGQITVGLNPDATFFDDFSKKVIVFNGKSMDASIIDPQTDKVLATIPLGGKPEAGVSDGKGKIYVNIEDTGEIVCFDATTFKILSRYKLNGGEEPSGLAIDRASSRLFTVCANRVMLILDAKTGRQITSLPIGDGCDGVVFDPILKTAYSSNGEGTITAIKEVTAEKFVVQETIVTKSGARTIALDAVTHHLFLPTADFEKATGTGRPKRISGSFQILEIGK
ncbi:YncE family protein [Pedobacter boryungensis]|uniref:YncE family protein n=1 Tax=Pedobacter boryungensis TaxID=869962 RepID=A0ABX2DCM5_9SPHI|nr:YncE family protein [Pedobacter boryungensis]NQX31284.1 YncE family protein [Pedobacter boryungensis]